jgi:hypothetical protein
MVRADPDRASRRSERKTSAENNAWFASRSMPQQATRTGGPDAARGHRRRGSEGEHVLAHHLGDLARLEERRVRPRLADDDVEPERQGDRFTARQAPLGAGEKHRSTGTPGTLLTIFPMPGLNGPMTPGVPRLPSGKKMRDCPASSASTAGWRTSLPGAAVRSIPIAFMPIMTIVRRQAVLPK